MSAERIRIALNVEVATCAAKSRNHLMRYLASGDLIDAFRFEREAEALQVLAYRADAANAFAEACRK